MYDIEIYVRMSRARGNFTRGCPDRSEVRRDVSSVIERHSEIRRLNIDNDIQLHFCRVKIDWRSAKTFIIERIMHRKREIEASRPVYIYNAVSHVHIDLDVVAMLSKRAKFPSTARRELACH